MAKIYRVSKYRRSAQTRRSIRKHAAIWGGTAARFEGFSTKAGK